MEWIPVDQLIRLKSNANDNQKEADKNDPTDGKFGQGDHERD